MESGIFIKLEQSGNWGEIMLSSSSLQLIKEEVAFYNQAHHDSACAYLLRFNEKHVFIDKDENGLVTKYLKIFWKRPFLLSEFFMFNELMGSYEKRAFSSEKFSFEELLRNV